MDIKPRAAIAGATNIGLWRVAGLGDQTISRVTEKRMARRDTPDRIQRLRTQATRAALAAPAMTPPLDAPAPNGFTPGDIRIQFGHLAASPCDLQVGTQ